MSIACQSHAVINAFRITILTKVFVSWRVYRYLSDDPTPVLRSTAYDHAHATVENPLNPHTLRTPTKNGREAIAYLTWIIDNYQNLPFFTVFMHGHERSWHMVERADDKLRALNFTDVALNGYTNIRCSETPQCLPGHGMDLSKASDTIKPRSLNFLPQFWRIIFPFDDDPPLPENLQVIGTAQFIVPREKILARPLEFWQGLRQPLTRTLKELEEMMPDLRKTDVDTSQEAQLSHVLGLVYEKIWHVVFGQPAEYCVAEDHCRSVTFAGAIECDKYIGYAEQSMGWERIKCRTDQDAMTRAALTQADAIGAAKRRLLKGED